MPLSDEHRDIIDEYADLVTIELNELQETNVARSSAIRVDLMDALQAQLADLSNAYDTDDQAAFDIAIGELDLSVELRKFFHEATKEAWGDFYADFLDAVQEVNTASWNSFTSVAKTSGILSPAFVLKRAWLNLHRGRKRPDKIPDEVKDIYMVELVSRAETGLRIHLSRIQLGFESKALTADDLPRLWEFNSIFLPAAERSIRYYYRQKANFDTLKRLKEEANPSIPERIWATVGWDSFGDFAFDLGLFTVTGGASAIAKFSKTVSKAINIKRKLGRANRLKKLIKAQEKALDRALEIRRKVLKRINRRNLKVKPNPRATRRLAREIDAKALRIWDKIRGLSKDYIKSSEASQDLLASFASASKIIDSVASKILADWPLRKFEDAFPSEEGRSKKSAAEHTVSTILKNQIKDEIKSHAYLGSEIDDLEKIFRRSILPGTHSDGVAWSKWFSRLFVRQLAINIIARSRNRKISSDVARGIFISSFTEALEEALVSLHFPSGFAGRVVKGLSNTLRRTIIGIADKIAKEMIAFVVD